MAGRITIQDIADELGLSRNTVSKALNNGEGLADATRDRVIKKAMEMGYKQFAYAAALAAAQQEQGGALAPATQFQSAHIDSPQGSDKSEIALISSTFLGGSHFASLMLDNFQNQIAQIGYSLGMHRINEKHLGTMQLPITFRREHVAAIICFEMFDREYDKMLCELGIPILFVDAPTRENGFILPADQLYMDNTTGIMQLVNDLLSAGKRRIGFIGDQHHCQSFFERYSAFRLAMLLNDAPVEAKHCIPVNARAEHLRELAALDELPDAFLCANDFVALDALQALRELGYDVPDDVWLAGFDDSTESRNCQPTLTTVHIHTQVMAFSAVQLLRTRMSEPNLDYRQVYTETRLIYRDSTPLAQATSS